MREIKKTTVFTKDLESLQPVIVADTWKIVCLLRENVFDRRLNIKKLEGYKNVWRVSFKKSYRLIYTFDKENICLLRVRHRKDIYRKGIKL